MAATAARIKLVLIYKNITLLLGKVRIYSPKSKGFKDHLKKGDISLTKDFIEVGDLGNNTKI